MAISYWGSDVCSSDLRQLVSQPGVQGVARSEQAPHRSTAEYDGGLGVGVAVPQHGEQPPHREHLDVAEGGADRHLLTADGLEQIERSRHACNLTSARRMVSDTIRRALAIDRRLGVATDRKSVG